MERKNNIGLRKGFSLFTVHYSLFTVFVLLFALCSLPSAAFAADKLVVTGTDGVTKNFVVTDGGKVGIGTSIPVSTLSLTDEGISYVNRGLVVTQHSPDPAAPLTIYRKSKGTSASPIAVSSGDYTGAVIFKGFTGYAYLSNINFGARVNGTVTGNTIQTDFFISNSLTDDNNPFVNGTVRFLIKSNGYVGIGTTNPQGTLDVNGTIYQRGSLLHADYVFEPNYKLESVEDHAIYMWENKHLKAMPKMMKDEKGNEVTEIGAYNRGVVEELEKAHIYIHQLNERVKNLEAQLKALVNH